MDKIEQIKAEIKRLKDKYKYLSSVEAKHKTDCYADLLSFINSLPEERLSEDLEEEIDDYIYPIQPWEVQEAPFTNLEKCARHFYELGLNARKEK